MNKFLIIIAVILISANLQATELTKGEKSKLYTQLLDACFNIQRSMDVNQHIPDDTMFEFCACTSDLTSSTLSKEDVDAVEQDGDYRALKFVQKNAEKYCAKKVFK